MKTKVFVSPDARRLQLERQAMALVMNCPVDRTSPSGCPLFGLRPLFARDKRAWIHGLAVEELEYLASYHACCAAEMVRVHAATGKLQVSVA